MQTIRLSKDDSDKHLIKLTEITTFLEVVHVGYDDLEKVEFIYVNVIFKNYLCMCTFQFLELTEFKYILNDRASVKEKFLTYGLKRKV